MRNRGFTLIELMVSMALFGLIAAGAMSLVMSGARTQSHSARVDVAQAGLRTAVDFITRDVMMISACATSGNITSSSGTFTAIDFTPATHDNIASGAPYAAGTDMLELYNVDGTTVGQVATATLAATTLTVAMEWNSSATQFVYTTAPFQSWLQVCDLTNAAITQLNNATATTLTVNALPLGFGANAYVMPSRHVKYYVSDTYFGSPNTSYYNTSMLMMSINGNVAQPLAEGVEDMQIAYGFDNDGNGIISETGITAGDDEWLFNVAGETIGAWSMANLRKIRVTLIVKSTSVDSGQTNFPGRPKAEDHAASATTTDGFVRRVLRTEMAVRTFNLSQ